MALPNPFEAIIQMQEQCMKKIDYLTKIVEQGAGIPTQGLHVERPMTVSQLSEYLTVSAQTIRKNIKTEGMPAHRIGKSRPYHFYKNEIDDWLKHSN